MNKPRTNLLLIEDNSGDIRLIQLMLSEAHRDDFELVVVGRLSAGISQLKEHHFDCILLDLTLPDGYGLATFQRLNSQAPRVPIIVFSGLDDETLAVQIVTNGAQDYLVKGRVDANLLVRSIYYAIERKQAELALQQANEALAGWVNELERRNMQVTQLNQMGEALQRCTSFEQACQSLAHHLPRMFVTFSGLLAVSARSKAPLQIVTKWGDLPEQIELSSCLTDCPGLKTRKPIWACGPDPVCSIIDKQTTTDAFCLPLLSQDEILGLLILCADQSTPPGLLENKRLSETIRRLAVTTADTTALALANLRLRDELRFQAIHDPLTGLFNRRYMEETLDREIHQAKRAGSPIGIIMMDIDRFKTFNDRYKHAGGDALLRALGRLLINRTRGGDIACRYGGEEFVLIFPDASLEDTRNRAESIRQQTAEMEITLHNRPLGRITLSVGVVAYPDYGATPDELLQLADTALYQAKGAGRNCVIIPPLPTHQ